MRVEWVSCGIAPAAPESAVGTGGVAYATLARQALATEHEVSVRTVATGSAASRLRRLVEWVATIRRLRALRFDGEVVIRDLLATAFAPFDARRVEIVLLHHLETFPTPYPAFWRWLNERAARRARRADRVIVVARYWQRELERRGVERIEVIPNAFDLDLFTFDPPELEELRARLELPPDKPLVYLGNARPEKGFREAMAVLAPLDATFFVTGSGAPPPPPLRHFQLPYRDYLQLLRLADVAVTMSTFDEGWCRTAHEAMLCRTPVVGSGRGGMAELLSEGGQEICASFAGLLPVVRALLESPERRREMGERGRHYARRFSLEPFRRRWCDLVRTLAHERPSAH